MFAQIIRGKTFDPWAVRPLVDRWMKALAPGATGWLGTTSGVTEDNQLVVLVRFESEEDASANSDRPEQGEWWAEMETLFDEAPTIRDSSEVYVRPEEISTQRGLSRSGWVGSPTETGSRRS